MIPGIMPAIRKKAAPDPGGGYSFTMTAGDSGVGIYGYDAGHVIGYFGSIDHEPIPGETLGVILSNNASFFAIYIIGDVMALVDGLDVWIDGVPLGVSGEWRFSDPATGIEAASVSPVFVPDQQYFIEIK